MIAIALVAINFMSSKLKTYDINLILYTHYIMPFWANVALTSTPRLTALLNRKAQADRHF
jgi:hypothetical protein